MMQKRILIGFVLTLFLSSCNSTTTTKPDVVTLTVFAASSLTDAFKEIATEFKAEHEGAEIVFNFASSSQLATQINEGALVDAFASANLKQMQAVQDAGNVTDDPAVFATNRLVVITPADNPGGISTLEDLAKADLRFVIAATGVPIRDYTDQMLAALATDANYGQEYSDAVYANIVSEEENVRQVVAKVALGEADAAVVYASDVTPDVKDQIAMIDVPDEYNVLAEYPIAVTTNAAEPELAQQFIDFVLSEVGQAIVAKWGFGSK